MSSGSFGLSGCEQLPGPDDCVYARRRSAPIYLGTTAVHPGYPDDASQFHPM
jgi:hypothetical protein